MHLRGIHTLVMSGCRQATIAGATFASLQGIAALGLSDCGDAAVAAAQSLGLPVRHRASRLGAFHYTFEG